MTLVKEAAVFPCYVCVRVLQAVACILGGQGAAGTDLLMAVIWAYLAYNGKFGAVSAGIICIDDGHGNDAGQ